MAAPEPPLSPDDKALLSMRADEFHVALARGSVGDWAPYLEGLTGAIRRAALAELAILELGHRYESGEQPTLEEYVKRFPELGPPGSEPATLLEEYERCRDRAGLSAMATRASKRIPTPAERVPPPHAASPPTKLDLDDGPSPPTKVEDEGEEDPLMKATRTVRASGKPPVMSGTPSGEGLVAVAQNYELIRELGRGAFGEVWLAKKMPSGIEKAVKILHQSADEENAQRELRSLELIKNLRHPYLLATEDFWVANNKLYIVTELADKSLRKRLVECKEDKLPGIPDDELFVYMREAAEGFDYLHARKIAHRDVKPDNILIVNGHAKVADFGLARESESPDVAVMSFAGTPAYMAPEVWGGEGGPPSDLYGFAMSYIELRQGRTPFKLGKVMEVMQAHMTGVFDFAEFIGDAERGVLEKALAKDPADRYPSCVAFVKDLEAALGLSGRPRTGDLPAPRPKVRDTPLDALLVRMGIPRRLTRRVLFGGGAALLAVIVLSIVLATSPTNGHSATPAKLPPGTAPSGDETITLAGGRTFPTWVALDGNPEVRFRLVVPEPTGPQVEPFFMLKSKVWNGWYGTPGDPERPVVQVTANEAAAFAEKQGGRLPTPDEWDYAAGYYSGPTEGGPFEPGSPLQLGLAQPIHTHGSGMPVNKIGLGDMATNGREWTSAALAAEGAAWNLVDGPGFQPRQLVVLRGRNFTLRTPLTFDIMKRELREPQTQFADVPSPYTSFRIVMSLPE